MKGHLKTINAPASWSILRKERKFIMKPKPGAHAREWGLSLNLVLKMLGLGKISRDVRNILRNEEVLIDGEKRDDPRFIVGLMDVVSFPKIKKNFRMILDKKGKLMLKEISEEESKFKICKVKGKSMLKKGKVQINLHDGKNILGEEKAKVGDSVVLELPGHKIKQVLELKKGAQIYLLKGNHVGNQGVLEEIKDKMIVYQKNKEKIETLKEYALVIGEKEPLIKIENE